METEGAIDVTVEGDGAVDVAVEPEVGEDEEGGQEEAERGATEGEAAETEADVAEPEAADADAEEPKDEGESSGDLDDPAEPHDPETTVNLTGDPEATVNLTGDPGDPEATVNLTGAELPSMLGRDDGEAAHAVTRGHLKGLLEALIFASDKPIKTHELAKAAAAPSKQVKELLEELRGDFSPRGMQLDEVAGGWIFRTNAAYAPFVRDLTKQKPVRLTRAQIETLAILAYRQPITRPEVDEIRGVDCGPVLKLLLERELVRMLGRKDEPGRPVIYGTTVQFLELFGLKSLKDLPTLREFTDLNEESRRTVERELGETLEETVAAIAGDAPRIPPPSDTLPPNVGEGP